MCVCVRACVCVFVCVLYNYCLTEMHLVNDKFACRKM